MALLRRDMEMQTLHQDGHGAENPGQARLPTEPSDFLRGHAIRPVEGRKYENLDKEKHLGHGHDVDVQVPTLLHADGVEQQREGPPEMMRETLGNPLPTIENVAGA